MKALLIDGSPASPSRVAKLLETIARTLEDKGAQTQVVELQALQLPTNNPDFHTNPQDHPDETVRKFVGDVAAADIIVLGTPLYHGSYSGLLKSALDHLHDDAFTGKAIGLASNANGPRNSLQAAQELVLVARTMKGDVHNCLIGTFHDDYGMKDGTFQIVDPAILKRIDLFATELAKQASLPG